MDFWTLGHSPDAPAVIEAQTGTRRTYAELSHDVDHAMAALPVRRPKKLILLMAQNSYWSLVTYVAALRSGHALLLTDATLDHDLLASLVRTYAPDLIFGSKKSDALPGYIQSTRWSAALERERESQGKIHDWLALLLNTSGSTGSPKLVRLSHKNLQANATSIAAYLKLDGEERPITSLPMSYSYGLSVINSHLSVGATLVLNEHGVLRREFWDAVDAYSCTSLAGVPYTYQMLLQMGLLRKRGTTLRTLTQAGGALAPNHIRQMHQLALERGFRFFVMYGQTEATARIAYVPFEHLGQKAGSIGVAIPGGSLDLDQQTGELVYTGPNVMLGYAECREDLAKGGELNGVLRTGDLARKDEDGFFYITGRLKRFLKLFGKRFNLDEVEQIVHARCAVTAACVGQDDLLVVAIETQDAEKTAAVSSMLCHTFGLPRLSVQVRALRHLPRTARGKIDYSALASWQHAISGPAPEAVSARGMTQS